MKSKLEITEVWTVWTGHITSEDFALLGSLDQSYKKDGNWGYIVYSRRRGGGNDGELDGFSPEFREIFKLAQKHDIKWIDFDHEGEPISGMKSFVDGIEDSVDY